MCEGRQVALARELTGVIDRTIAACGVAVEHHQTERDELALAGARLVFAAHPDPGAQDPIGVFEWTEYEPHDGHVQVTCGVEHCLSEVLGHVRNWIHDHHHPGPDHEPDRHHEPGQELDQDQELEDGQVPGAVEHRDVHGGRVAEHEGDGGGHGLAA